MGFIKRIFNKKENQITTNEDFWRWFIDNEKKFYKVIKQQGDINKDFFEKLRPKLDELKEGFWFLTGMYNDTTAELIFTADGNINHIVFVEELVQKAPNLDNWKFTALKQPSEENDFGIRLNEFVFDEATMSFYSNENNDTPDEVDITITHPDYSEENKSLIIQGVYLALDNSIGELNFVLSIDNINIVHPDNAEKELIPIKKLKSYLIWREKEFVEKYNGFRRDTESDNYVSIEATLKNGMPIVGFINSDLLKWNSKASHPWILKIEIKYDGSDNNGMPDKKSYDRMNDIEDRIMDKLKDYEGYLNIGRETGDSLREIYFACIGFRKPSKVIYEIQQDNKGIVDLTFDIYKDKYWQSFERFKD